MSKILRKTLTMFASGASNNGQFGSAQASAPLTSTDPSVIQGLAAWASGWLSAVIGGQKLPPLEEFQGVSYVHSYMTAYLFQEGIPEYDAGTTYFQHSVVKKAGTYQIYGSVTDTNVGNALTNPTYWTLLQDLSAPSSAQAAYGLTTNSGNAYSVTTSPAVTAPAAGALFAIKFNAANTGAITLNVGGSGAVSVLDVDGNALASGAIVANRDYALVYNGTAYVLLETVIPKPAYGVTTNSTNAFSTTATPAVSYLTTGQIVSIDFNAANTGTATLNVNGTGAITMLDQYGNALTSGATAAGFRAIFVYDGTNWTFVTPTANSIVKTVKKQIFTAGGTYTPSTGMIYCIVEGIAGGGGGGGIASASNNVSSGGGAGSYSKVTLTAAQVGASQTVTIGALGTAGPASNTAGGTGGNTSLGSLLTTNGGVGGGGGNGTGAFVAGGAGGAVGTGDFTIVGANGSGTLYATAGAKGASSIWGGGGDGGSNGHLVAGSAGTGYGSAGGGAMGASAALTGGAGTQGALIITEFCSQ